MSRKFLTTTALITSKLTPKKHPQTFEKQSTTTTTTSDGSPIFPMHNIIRQITDFHVIYDLLQTVPRADRLRDPLICGTTAHVRVPGVGSCTTWMIYAGHAFLGWIRAAVQSPSQRYHNESQIRVYCRLLCNDLGPRNLSNA